LFILVDHAYFASPYLFLTFPDLTLPNLILITNAVSASVKRDAVIWFHQPSSLFYGF